MILKRARDLELGARIGNTVIRPDKLDGNSQPLAGSKIIETVKAGSQQLESPGIYLKRFAVSLLLNMPFPKFPITDCNRQLWAANIPKKFKYIVFIRRVSRQRHTDS